MDLDACRAYAQTSRYPCGFEVAMRDKDRAGLALEKVQVLANEEVAPKVWRMEFAAPVCALACLPGQFVELKVPGDASEILRLPFSVWDVSAQNGTIELLYQVLGHGTTRMTQMRLGDGTDLIGPVGNGFNPPKGARRALLVSGGLGAAPLTMLARRLCGSGVEVDIAMGAPSSARLVGRERLSVCGRLHIATDDGSEGLHGFSTEVSEALIEGNDYDYIATCGPRPMERIVASQANAAGVPCEVSLESLMACGIGACLSCVTDTRHGKKRVCVDGPVFDAAEVVW